MEDQWDCEIANYYVKLPLQHKNLLSPFEYPYFFEWVFRKIFWTLLGYIVAKPPTTQEIQLGSPDHFSSWEGGVWGRDYPCHNVIFIIVLVQLNCMTTSSHQTLPLKSYTWAWENPTLAWSTGTCYSTDWPTDQLCPSQSHDTWYVAHAHTATPSHTYVRGDEQCSA